MKKYILFVLLMICPIFVHAADYEYHVCKEGCEYTELDAVFGIMNNSYTGYQNDVKVYIDDDATYDLSDNNYVSSKYGWVSGIYMYKVNKLTIEGTKGAPKITSSNMHQDGNYVPRSIFIETNDDVIVKNIKIEVPKSIMFEIRGVLTLENVDVKATEFYSYFTSTDNVVKNCTFNSNIYLDDNSNISNTKIDGSLFVRNRLTGDNLTVNGYIENNGTMDLKNSTIDASDYDYGILFPYSDCLGDCGSERNYSEDSSIKNTVIKNASVSAIMYNRSSLNQKKQLKIDKVDMGSNPTSIIMYNIYSWGPNEFYDGYSVVVSNSKVSGAETYRALHEDWNGDNDAPDLKDVKSLNMYFDVTNNWVKPIYRVNDPSKKNNKKANIVETNSGRIVVERKNSGVLIVNVDKDKPLSEYFEEIGEVLGEIKVDDPTIVKVVNGKLVPLKKGETTVRFTVDNTSYVLGVKVESDPTNPETLDKITIATVLFVISLGLVTVIYTKKVLD